MAVVIAAIVPGLHAGTVSNGDAITAGAHNILGDGGFFPGDSQSSSSSSSSPSARSSPSVARRWRESAPYASSIIQAAVLNPALFWINAGPSITGRAFKIIMNLTGISIVIAPAPDLPGRAMDHCSLSPS